MKWRSCWRLLKWGSAVGFFGSLSVYAIRRGLDWAACVAMILAALIAAEDYTRQFLGILLGLGRSARKARIGDFQVEVDGPKSLIGLKLQDVMLSDLSAAHVSLLLTVHMAGRWRRAQGSLDFLRSLRDRGWLAYNADTLAGSTEVWLTPAGHAVARLLISGFITDTDAPNEALAGESPNGERREQSADAVSQPSRLEGA